MGAFLQVSSMADDQDTTYTSFFERLIEGIPGATAVIVADRDGVPLISVGEIEDTQKVASMATTFSMSADQASKLRIGSCKTIVNMFSDQVVVHINHLPLIISIFGTSECNIGLALDLADDIKSVLSSLRTQISANLDLQ